MTTSTKVLNNAENQEILFKALCNYLPYGLKINVHGNKEFELDHNGKAEDLFKISLKGVLEDFQCKPILRLLSTITDDVINEIYSDSWIAGEHTIVKTDHCITITSYEDFSSVEIWLNKPQCNKEWVNDILYKNHYDLKGLIEKGLADRY